MKTILKHRLLIIQLFFWALYTSYSIYEVHGYLGWSKAVVYIGLRLFFLLAACYIHYFFIFPIWLEQKKVTRYVILTFSMIAALVVLRISTENVIMPLLVKNEAYYQTIKLSRVISTVWDLTAFSVFIALIKFTIDRFDLESKQKQLENEKLMTELNYLKAQINPHFLFNTLHNLNSLVYTGSSAANDVIIKLSNIMRYMIYEASKQQVALQQEVAYLEDYIHLESIRFDHGVNIEFEKKGDFAKVMIAPLMLVTMVENAFKHGIRNDGKANWIKIKLEGSDNALDFTVSNTIADVDSTRLPSGFGLENLKRRLQLSYPDAHRLQIDQENNVYRVQLKIKL